MLSRRSFIVGLPVTAAALALPATALAAPGNPGTGLGPGTPPPVTPQQSPIALHTSSAVPAPELPELVVDYPDSVDLSVSYVSRDPDDPSGCTTRGREEVIEAAVPPGSAGITLDGVHYELEQFHFHTPAEHTLDGIRFPIEQHFVHTGPGGELLVIGLFLAGGGPGDTVQDEVLRELPDECDEEIVIAGANLACALPGTLSTLRYPGSLTSAPYTEGVSWLVLSQYGRLADASISGLEELFPDGDSRELQPLDGRVVRLREQ